MTARIWKTGDEAILHYEGPTRVWTAAVTIELASPNGRSLMVAFEGIVAGYVGRMPLLQSEEGVFRDLINGATARLS